MQVHFAITVSAVTLFINGCPCCGLPAAYGLYTKGLPESTDWETLEKLGFKDRLDYLVPEYAKLNDGT